MTAGAVVRWNADYPAPAASSELERGWVELLSRWRWDWFCTFTFAPGPRRNLARGVAPEAALKAFRYWWSRLEVHMHGKHRRRLWWVVAQERHLSGAVHLHALVGGPGLEHVRRLDWLDEWVELQGWARIERPDVEHAVAVYCSRYVAKDGQLTLGGALDATWRSRVGSAPALGGSLAFEGSALHVTSCGRRVDRTSHNRRPGKSS